MPPNNKLSPFVQAFIVIFLLLCFAGLIFIPVKYPEFKPEADVKQNLYILLTAVVFFFIGKTTESNRDAAITAAAIAPVPVTAPGTTTVTPPAQVTVTTEAKQP